MNGVEQHFEGKEPQVRRIVATRMDAVILTIKSARDIADARIRKHAQTSANRWHLDVRLSDAKHVDGQLKGWLKDAYDLAG
ncbi:MAG: DUF5655 domain-containing protein [Acidobacteriota bacterium]